MTTEISTAARRITSEYNAQRHRGGRLHVWNDGYSHWLPDSPHGRSWFETPGPGYCGSIHLNANHKVTQMEVQHWLDEHDPNNVETQDEYEN